MDQNLDSHEKNSLISVFDTTVLLLWRLGGKLWVAFFKITANQGKSEKVEGTHN